MTQLYVLSQDGTSAINLSQFEYVYIGKNPGAGWYQMMRGDAAEEHVVLARDPAPNQFAANGKKPVRRGGS